jgi:hypothetical protein
LRGTVRFINVLDIIGTSDGMKKSIQIVGLEEEVKARFRTLCAKEGKTSAQMFLAMIEKAESTVPAVPAS